MSDVYIFLGPTLALTSARAELEAVYLPPVAEGDVYRLGRLRPRAVGIVDGFFDRVPAVWHKEIMWIMERGVYVFGSAEMGALRAVELEMFGMRGVGWVYQAFKDGTLEQDDEVAIAHGSGSRGFRPLSEAMVNIRRTLLEAEHQKIICEITRELLTAVAKAFFYRDRNWTRLLEAGEVKGDSAELTALRQWLPDGRVDQKASDAVAMLREMRGFLATNPAPLQVRWRTANTNVWNAARKRAGSVPAGGTARAALTCGPKRSDRLCPPPAMMGITISSGLWLPGRLGWRTSDAVVAKSPRTTGLTSLLGTPQVSGSLNGQVTVLAALEIR